MIEKNSAESAGFEWIKWSLYWRHVCFYNPCARAESHQQKRARKLCSATLTRSHIPIPLINWNTYCSFSNKKEKNHTIINIVGDGRERTWWYPKVAIRNCRSVNEEGTQKLENRDGKISSSKWARWKSGEQKRRPGYSGLWQDVKAWSP